MRTIPDKFDAVSTLPAAEFNDFKNESLNLMDTADLTPSASDLYQVTKAVSTYAARGDYYTDTGSANAYLLAVADNQKSPAIYANGMRARFRPANANTTACTVNVAGLGSKSLKNADGTTALVAGDLPEGADCEIVYDGTYFRLVDVATNRSPVNTFLSSLCGCRLSLHATNPLPVADVLAATSVKLIPYISDQISLWNGVNWQVYSTADTIKSVALPAAANTSYDVFASQSGSVISLSLIAWASSAVRASAVSRFQGVLTLTSDRTKRLMGTVRTTTVAGQAEDSNDKRFLYNVSNQVVRSQFLQLQDIATWSCTSTTIQPPDGNVTVGETRGLFILGDITDTAVTLSGAYGMASSDVSGTVGVGIDSTTAFDITGGTVLSASQEQGSWGQNTISASLGQHFSQLLEQLSGAGTVVFFNQRARLEWLG